MIQEQELAAPQTEAGRQFLIDLTDLDRSVTGPPPLSTFLGPHGILIAILRIEEEAAALRALDRPDVGPEAKGPVVGWRWADALSALHRHGLVYHEQPEGVRAALAAGAAVPIDNQGESAKRIDNLRRAIDKAVEGLNAAWGGFGPSEALENVISDLQKARTNDDIAQGRDWPPVILAAALDRPDVGLRKAGSEPTELRQRAVEALVRRVAELDIRAWQRDGEEVVTISRSDCDKLLSITKRARQLTRTRQRMEVRR